MSRSHRPSPTSEAPAAAAPTEPAAPAETTLPPASAALLATFSVLFGNVTNGQTSLEENLLVTKEAALLAHLTPNPARVDPTAPDELPGYRAAVRTTLAGVRAAMAKRPFALHGGRRYARGTTGLVKKAAKVFKSVRQRGDELLVLDTDAALRFGLGQGSEVSVKVPSSLRGGLVSQRSVLTAEANQLRLVAARFRPDRCVARIDRVLPPLEGAIATGAFGETTVGDVGTELRQALVKFDIVRAHARAYLEDFVSEDAAEAFDAEVPHRHAGAAAEATPTTPAPPPASGGTPGSNGSDAPKTPNAPATPNTPAKADAQATPSAP